MSKLTRIARARLTATTAAVIGLLGFAAALPVSSNASPSLGQLHSSLQQAQSQAANLSSSVGHLSGLISSLSSQISFVRQREAAVRAELASDRAALKRTTAALVQERRKLAMLVARLHRAQSILANQLVSNYESGSPDFMTVLLNSDGFSQLLNQLNDLSKAEQEQKTEIHVTQVARDQVHAATVRLARLQASYRQQTLAAATRERALAGMNSLLSSREAALQKARAAQQAALAVAQSRGQALQSQIAQVEAQQAAAERAAQPSPGAPSAPGSPPTTSLAPSGGWAIPAPIVMCESGGQNLPPNSAGASGYYQIIPGTWRLYGGSGPAAWLASKAEQDAVASRIWDGGRGASAWVCAHILGYV
jgi:septal ring factor EnvC (AmiA/AmiB activator)